MADLLTGGKTNAVCVEGGRTAAKSAAANIFRDSARTHGRQPSRRAWPVQSARPRHAAHHTIVTIRNRVHLLLRDTRSHSGQGHCRPDQTLERGAEPLFAAVLKGDIDKDFRRAYKSGVAQLDAMRAARRWTKSA